MKKPDRPAPAADVRQSRRRALKNGAYASALAVALLAALVLLNLVVGALPAQYTRFDISTGHMFTLTDTTKELLQTLDRDVTAYYLGITGEEDTAVTQLLDRYAGQSAHFTWQQKDPNLYPSFAQQYDAGNASVGSVILTCGDNSALVDYWSMYEFDYSSYYSTGDTSYSFAAEGAITAGIANVTRTEAWPMYCLTGHGESALDADFTATLTNSGFAVAELNLATAGAIPDDAAVLLLNAPQVDFSAADAALLNAYLAGGGRMLVLTDITVETPDLDTVLAAYGLTRQAGVLVEQDQDHTLYGYPPSYLLPQVDENDITAGMTAGLYALAPVAQGILRDETQDFVYTPLLTTTDASYSLVDYLGSDTLAQGEDDPSGPFDVAVAAEDGESGAKLVWINCGNFLQADADATVSGGNSQLMGCAANWLNDQEAAVVIDAKSMSGTLLSVPTGVAIPLGLVFVIVLPLGGIIAGAVYCLLRRRR